LREDIPAREVALVKMQIFYRGEGDSGTLDEMSNQDVNSDGTVLEIESIGLWA
jgi:hypothetical protein